MVNQAFVDTDAAREAARREIETGPQQDDPQFRAWRDGSAGEPRLVHDLLGRPAYWLVPVQHQETTVGAVRVLGDGRAVASIAYRAGSNPLALSPTQVVEQAAAAIAKDRGERAGAVLLVHDGPPGREAWRVEVLANDQLLRWIFVTPGGIYERELGDLGQDQTLEG
jgi:hypothetical protein